MRIVIYEDYWGDVKARYSRFLKEHDVLIYLHLTNDENFNRGREYLVEKGFLEKNIHFGLPSENPDADLYFCDGLSGHCLEILPKLPKEKSFLLSGDEYLRNKARSEGFNVITTYIELEEIVSLANILDKSKTRIE